jgi:CRP-like cAMP-binding protein
MERPVRPLPVKKPSILVVEDNFLIAAEVCDIVQNSGCDVVGPAARPEGGLALLGEKPVDGAILDVDLGGRRSFRICEELERRQVPFYFLTGYGRDVIPPAFCRAPVLSKPAQALEIGAALRGLGLPAEEPPAATPGLHEDVGNGLLDSLDPEDRALLAPCLEPVQLAKGQILQVPGGMASHVWFPIHGVAAVVAEAGQSRADVAMIGPEGLAGLTSVLDSGTTAHGIVVRFSGRALRIPVRTLMPLLVQSRRLHGRLLRYSNDFLAELAFNALTAARASVRARVAHWLLMMADRLDSDQIEITHEMLAAALAVRRAGVTVALHWLEGSHTLRSDRRRIQILDRDLLEEEAEGFYRPFGARS